MTRRQKSTTSRRTVLSAMGTGLATSLLGTGATAAQPDAQYVLVQDGSCIPVRPIRGDEPADAFYEYQLPERYVSEDNGAVVGEDASYSSAGAMDLQRARTSIAFLYRGPEGLSLVVVHGSVEDDAGSVTFELAGLPEDGEWIVTDDFYRNPDTGEIASTNYDRWDVEDGEHRIDWTWGSAGTDGGVFRDLGDDFEVTVHPAFNEAATLFDQYYEGTITGWEFLSGTGDDPARVSLDLEAPIRITTGSCEDHDTPSGTDQRTEKREKTATETKTEKETERETEKRTDQQVEQEQEVDVEQEQEIDADQGVETERKQEVKTEQAQETEITEEDEEAEEEDEEEEKQEEEEGEEGKNTEKGENERDDGPGNGRGKGHEKGRGEGHEKGRGQGHEKDRGKGHEKHDDEED